MIVKNSLGKRVHAKNIFYRNLKIISFAVRSLKNCKLHFSMTVGNL